MQPAELLYEIINLNPPAFPTATVSILDVLLQTSKPLEIREIVVISKSADTHVCRVLKKLTDLKLVERISSDWMRHSGYKKDWAPGHRLRFKLNREAALALFKQRSEEMAALEDLLKSKDPHGE